MQNTCYTKQFRFLEYAVAGWWQ